jgi:TonB family protein
MGKATLLFFDQNRIISIIIRPVPVSCGAIMGAALMFGFSNQFRSNENIAQGWNTVAYDLTEDNLLYRRRDNCTGMVLIPLLLANVGGLPALAERSIANDSKYVEHAYLAGPALGRQASTSSSISTLPAYTAMHLIDPSVAAAQAPPAVNIINGLRVPPGPGNASSISESQIEKRLDEYISKIVPLLKGNWHPPKVGGPRKISVLIKVHRSGLISAIQLFKSCGVEVADKAGLEAVKETAPLPALPQGSPEEIEAEFGMDFKIKYHTIDSLSKHITVLSKKDKVDRQELAADEMLLGSYYCHAHDYDAARRHFSAGMEETSNVYGTESAALVETLLTVACDFYCSRKEYAKAKQVFIKASELARKDKFEIARLQAEQAEFMEIPQGNWVAAELLLKSALNEFYTEKDEINYEQTLELVGHCLALQHRHADALAIFEASMNAGVKDSRGSMWVLRECRDFAEICLALQDKERAMAKANQILLTYEAKYGFYSPQSLQALQNCVFLALSLGDDAEAAKCISMFDLRKLAQH